MSRQYDCSSTIDPSSPPGNAPLRRPPRAPIALLGLWLLCSAGCGTTEGEYQNYEDARRAPGLHDLGPHGGHLIALGGGKGYAEIHFDETTRKTVIYVLGEDFLTSRAVGPGDVALDLLERRVETLELKPSPLPNDPAGRSSRFEAAAPLPEKVRSIEDLSGIIRVSLDGEMVQGGLHLPSSESLTNAPPRPAASTAGRILPMLAVYCVLIVAASFAGGWLPSLMTLTHTRMQFMISFVGGLMLGIGLLHLLPHAVVENGSIDASARWAVIGLLTMFFLIRAFHFHQHGVAEVPCDEFSSDLATEMSGESASRPRSQEHDCGHDHDHDHDHDHGRAAAAAPAIAAGAPAGGPALPVLAAPSAARGEHHGHGHSHHGHSHSGHAHGTGTPHALDWVGVAIGLALHTAIDGMVLAAAMQADLAHHPSGAWIGLAPFLAILLHKPLDAVSITSLMRASGWSAGWRHLVNAGFALMCPLGALLFLLGLAQVGGHQSAVVGAALAFSAGVFLCISLGDLLPELEFHSHHRLRLSAALLMGIALAWGLGWLEPAHLHGNGGSAHHGHSH